MRGRNIAIVAAVSLVLFSGLASLYATIPPRQGAQWSQSYLEKVRSQPQAFTYARALKPMVQRIQANRAALARGDITPDQADAVGGVMITGSRSIPVLMAKFANTAADPYPVSDLQTELFDGPWPTGTMTQFYQEISYGNFSVTGTVLPWGQVAQNDTFYEGPSGCNGICNSGKTGDLLQETLNLNDASVDFSMFDNDGADGVPNSGDDDGFVDFVAFVHPESGGECGNSNIWSHRWQLNGWTGSAFTTNDAKSGGGFIQIDDYVIMPALACNNSTMIQIGVFAHEFGHAFGLPDLYDTDTSNGDSEGIGNWGLMAGGSWGGNGTSPEKPTHMCAWSKEFLGWINPVVVTSDKVAESIPNIEENAVAYKIPISGNEYYLVSNRQKKLFDINLPASGILIWRINQAAVNAGLANNTVNADENNKGVDLEEADGKKDLDNTTNRGDAGDIFPGSSGNKTFDNGSNPSSSGSTSVCDISNTADPMVATLQVTDGKCANGGGICSSLTLSPGPGFWKLWLVLLIPLLAAAALLLRDRLLPTRQGQPGV